MGRINTENMASTSVPRMNRHQAVLVQGVYYRRSRVSTH